MIIDIYVILPLVCALFVTFFGFFVLSKNSRSRMNQLLFGFCVSMFFWMFGTFMMFVTRGNVDSSVFWDRFVYAGVVFMPSLMHHFSLIFTKNRGQRKLLIINYSLSVFFLFASRTRYFVNDLYYYSWGVHSHAQILHTVFLAYFFIGTGIFFRNCLLYYRRVVERIAKIQIIYVFVSFAIVIFVGGSAYLFAYGIDTRFPFAYLSGLIFPVMLFYTVSRYHLLEARLIVVEILVGLTAFLIVLQIFFSNTLSEIIMRVLSALVVAMIGILLVKSMKTEVSRREEIQHLAEQLNAANAKLQALDKLKSEFLSIAAHQLRTPLTVIKGYVSMIQEGDYGKIDNPKIDTVLKNVYTSNEHLIYLVNDFLDVSRIEGGCTSYTFVKTDLKKVAEELVIEISLPVKEKNLQFKVEIAKNLPAVTVDMEKIRNVMWNFLTNAVKYTPHGWLKMELFIKGRKIVYQVTDNGIGLTKLDLENVYQKFYRAEEAKKITAAGVGLGLFVCKKFIEAHHGEVFVESPGPGQGATFGFRLPMKK